MFDRLSRFTREFRWRIHSFALGMTLALGVPLLGQGCIASSQ